MTDKYTKVVYESDPIGNEQIVLVLTTFDVQAFKENEKLEQIPVKKVTKTINMPRQMVEDRAFAVNYNEYQVKLFETIIEKFVRETYDEQLEEMKAYIEELRNIKFVPNDYSNVKNVSNSDNVYCNIVYGNVSNCDNIYCNEIKGNVTNCDKIIYKGKVE